MQQFSRQHWPLVLALGAVALLRPVLEPAGVTGELGPVGPLLVTLAITVFWIVVVELRRVSRPVVTLVCAGIAYGVFTVALSAVLSLSLAGEVRVPMVTPVLFGVPSVLFVNAAWGGIAGLVAAALRRARADRVGSTA